MKNIAKVISIVLFFSVLITSCAPVTAVPTLTPTFIATALPTSTPTPLRTPTSSPTIMPTSTPGSNLQGFLASSGPQKPASFYKLRSWLERDYGYISSHLTV